MENYIRFAIVSLTAFLSGGAALVYQISWQRQLTSVLGTSHRSTTIVVLAFFIGFAAGAWLARRVSDRIANIFWFLAAIELLVGLFALFSPELFDLAERIALLGLDPSTTTAQIALASVFVLLILIPTIPMGATLPAFFKAGIFDFGSRGSLMGILGGVNTAGALAGALVTTFVWMGYMPTQQQVLYASLGNFAAFVLLVIGARFFAPEKKVAVASAQAAVPSTLLKNKVVWAYALSGAAALGLEILWNRYVYLSQEHTVYAFALTLTVYLASYTLGTIVATIWMKHRSSSTRAIGACMLLSMVTTVAGLYVYRNGMQAYDFYADYGFYGGATIITMLVMAAPTFFMGLAMPQVFSLVTGDLDRVGEDSGLAQMFNNIGSIIAIALVGFIAIPFLGHYLSTLFCVALIGVGALLLLDWSKPNTLARTVYIVIVFGALAAIPVNLHRGHFKSHYRNLVQWSEDDTGIWGVERLPMKKVGGVIDSENRWKEMLVMRANGYYESFLPLPAVGTIEGFYLLAAMMKPKIESAYMVGMAHGVSAYEFLKLSELKEFTAAEISKSSVKLARAGWEGQENNIFNDPRFRLVEADGRMVLKFNPRKYDVIYSGTKQTYYPGSTHLYSKEYWTLVKERLNDDGVFFQWLPANSLLSGSVTMKTFLEVFPEAMFVDYGGVPYMIGFKSGIPKDLDKRVVECFERRRGLFEHTQFPTPELLLKKLYVSNGTLEKKAEVPLNTDSNPVMEYRFALFDEKAGGSRFGRLSNQYMKALF